MKKRYKVPIGIVILLLLIGIGGKLALDQMEKDLLAMESIELTKIDLSAVKDGIMSGEYKAGPIKVVIEVEVNDHSITALNLIEHKNGQGQAAEAILDRIIEQQSVLVDVVSGATYSSKAIQLAVLDALSE